MIDVLVPGPNPDQNFSPFNMPTSKLWELLKIQNLWKNRNFDYTESHLPIFQRSPRGPRSAPDIYTFRVEKNFPQKSTLLLLYAHTHNHAEEIGSYSINPISVLKCNWKAIAGMTSIEGMEDVATLIWINEGDWGLRGWFKHRAHPWGIGWFSNY